MQKGISKSTLSRLPVYLQYLKSLPKSSTDNISSTMLAGTFCLGEVQVRKDLASVSNAGKPKIGYNVSSLILELENFLGYNNVNDAVIIGAGRLGKALLGFNGFRQYGLNIVAAFDVDENKLGKTPEGKSIITVSEFSNICSRLKIHIGIITVPTESAQAVCNQMIENGILAIWNFAPTHLDVPPNILVHNENMALSLALLSNHLKENTK